MNTIRKTEGFIAGFAERNRKHAPDLLRIGISLVFIWFGINQLLNPQSFLGYIPVWLSPHSASIQHEHPLQLIHELPLTAHFIIMGNGILETLFGMFLLTGILVRISALILSGHLFLIALSLGYNDLMIRDIGLCIATFTVFLQGKGEGKRTKR